MHRRTLLELASAAALAPGLARAAPTRPPAPVADSDRYALEATLAQFVWGLDTGQPEIAAGAFVPGGTIRALDGREHAVGAFVHEAFAATGPGREHYPQLIAVESKPTGAQARFYWSRVGWKAGAPTPALEALGTFEVGFVRAEGGWRIATLAVGPWDSASVTVAKL